MTRNNFIANLSIRNRLVLSILVVTYLVIGVGFISIAYWHIIQIKNDTKDGLTLNAELVGNYCIVPLTFEDTAQANEVLSKLHTIAFIEQAVLYDLKGKQFASYPVNSKNPLTIDMQSSCKSTFKNGEFFVVEDIYFKDKKVGKLTIRANADQLRQAKHNMLFMLSVLIIVLSIISFLLANRIQQHISKPIITLSKHFSNIASTKNFNLQTKPKGNDEISSLYKGFNTLLNEINNTQNELKSSVLQLNQAQKVAKVGSWHWDLNTNKLDWSKEMYEIYGLPEEVNNKIEAVKELVVVEDKAMFEQAMALISEAETPESIEYRVKRKDGIEVDIESNLIKIKDKNGRVTSLIGTAQDVSERKNTEKEVRQLLEESKKSGQVLLSVLEDEQFARNEIKKLNDELEEKVKERTAQLESINKELETFTYSVSHDLKAPLRGIDGYSKLLQDMYKNQLDEEANIFLNNIRSSASKMNQLINDLLDYSRLERVNLVSENIEINTLLHSITQLYKKELEEFNFSLTINSQYLSINTDSRGLSIALRNIIENAIKFSKSQSAPCIEIKTMEKEQSLVISVKDNGIGFEMKYEQKIFDIFQRLHRAEEYAGTGIGLALVSKAMQRLKGKAWAKSKLNQGATFYLEIPK
jgi:PAS domain S-box-containing protein